MNGASKALTRTLGRDGQVLQSTPKRNASRGLIPVWPGTFLRTDSKERLTMSNDAPPPPPPTGGMPPGDGSGGYGAPPPAGPPPGGYGAPPPPGGYGAQPGNSTTAIWSLVLGIVGILCCGLFAGIPAIILGKKAQNDIDASGGAQAGRGMATAGFILGIISCVLSVIGIILFATGAANFDSTFSTSP